MVEVISKHKWTSLIDTMLKHPNIWAKVTDNDVWKSILKKAEVDKTFINIDFK